MKLVLAPVLGFREAVEDRWRVSVLVVTVGEGEPTIVAEAPGRAGPSRPLLASGRRTAWRADIEVERAQKAIEVTYRIKGMEADWRFTVPAAGMAPRMSYASCNGFSDPKAMKSVEQNNMLWTAMAERHAQEPYHLMLLGGDQLYADSLWAELAVMHDWAALDWDQGNRRQFTKEMARQLNSFYFDLYCKRWSQPQVQVMLSSVPTLMMWDDHDIIDGWGSYPEERQNCAVFQGLFAIAREHFRVFQLHGADLEPAFLTQGRGFTYGHNFGGLAILALDMRSERTIRQVLSPESWEAVYRWLDGQTGCQHLLLLSSIPVVHPSFSLLEGLLSAWPRQQELEDDLRDHWSSRSHKAERLRLVHRLLSFAKDKGTRVTILSGDVHVAAVGVIESQRAEHRDTPASVINQLTSSGIVHPAPPALVAFALEHLFKHEDEIDQGIRASMQKFPGTERRFIGSRNWLSLEPDNVGPNTPGRIWANWFVEDSNGSREPYTKVIHPAD